MKPPKIYAVLHNPMFHESSAETISLHWTIAGAYKSFRKMIVDAYKEERENHLTWGFPRRGEKYNRFEWFGIRKRQIEE